MEVVEEEIVIVGAGIAGLAISLGLHRQGLRSIVLEAWGSMRATGFALTVWTNAWKALDALGIGNTLREQHVQIHGNVATSITSGLPTSEVSFEAKGTCGSHEIRCVRRKALLEALGKELPQGTIRFSSKVVNIEESGNFKLVHLADGTILKAKVLIGCDGVNSVVAKWLGWSKPAYTGRSAMRGFAEFKNGHGFEPRFKQFFGKGVRAGFITCDDKDVYWFLTYNSSSLNKEVEEDPAKMKHFLLTEPGKLAEKMRPVVENSESDSISSAPLRYRHPWELLTGNISKGNVCVAGDALHPMTPDIGQGGCSALEDAVVLARCLSLALSQRKEIGEDGEEEYKKIQLALEKYAKERRWRSFDLIATAYMVGWIQQGDGKMMGFIRDKFLSAYMAGLLLKMSDFDCGKLSVSP